MFVLNTWYRSGVGGVQRRWWWVIPAHWLWMIPPRRGGPALSYVGQTFLTDLLLCSWITEQHRNIFPPDCPKVLVWSTPRSRPHLVVQCKYDRSLWTKSSVTCVWRFGVSVQALGNHVSGLGLNHSAAGFLRTNSLCTGQLKKHFNI